MKRLLLLFLLTTPFLGKASHIVGGEFELLHISGSTYRLNLVLYFDLHNGAPLAKDGNVTARIFRKSDDAVMMNVGLPLTNEVSVVYSQPECSIGELETSKLIYTSIITLSPALFNDPQGYYISWERCCRNYGITNVESNPPGSGMYAGQTFYLEIPPVVKDGEPFIDSSPRLFPPLSDYACQGKPYYVDFGGTDDDGDSLVYSLVTPLNTKSADALPPGPPGQQFPRPAPYPDVVWRPGYSLTNIMKGAPDLAISNEGLLTVTPTEVGLFVFAVKCEEFRDGVRIGETRRDFQMLAVQCRTAVPPVIKGKKINESVFTYQDNMSITFPHSISANDRCIEVQVSDDDINNDFDNFMEKVKIRVIAIGNSKNIQEVVLPAEKTATLTGLNPTVTFRICFDECPLELNTPYKIGIIASDDACALPLMDTLRMAVTVQTPPNTPAHFVEPVSHVIESLNEGSTKIWPIKVVDDEGDLLTVSYKTDGFILANVGMDFDFTQPIQGIVEDSLTWNAQCDKYDFSTKQNFSITLFADDKDLCSFNNPDTAKFNLTLIPPPNADPIIDTDLTPVFSERIVETDTFRIFEKIEFNVTGQDADAYPITLQALGVDLNLTDYKVDFPGATGVSPITSHFTWPLDCQLFDLNEQSLFHISFLVVDKNNWCRIYQADTVDVSFKIIPPINAAPQLNIQDVLHPSILVGTETSSFHWDNPIEFTLTGTDSDENPMPDDITIEMADATGSTPPIGFSFTPVTGQREIITKLTWTPDCSIFNGNDTINHYQFDFRIFDNHCASADTTTLSLFMDIKDYPRGDTKFNPASVITPNGDAFNSYFALDGYDLRPDGTDPDVDVGLPLDNCVNKFEYINIYNRWGKLVFTSNNRYFRWHAPDAGAGVYYYFLRFSNDDYKGSILVRY
jgi:hypothetical protein